MTRIGTVAQNPSMAQDVIGTLDQGTGGGTAAESTGKQGKAFEAFLANMSPSSGDAATADAPMRANGTQAPQAIAAKDTASATSLSLRVAKGSAAATNLLSLAAAAARSSAATAGPVAQPQGKPQTSADLAGAKQAAATPTGPATPVPAPLAAAALLQSAAVATSRLAAADQPAATPVSTDVAAESASAVTAAVGAADAVVVPVSSPSAQGLTKPEQAGASSALASATADAAAPVLKFALRLAGAAAVKQDGLVGDGSGLTTSKSARHARHAEASQGDASAKSPSAASLSSAVNPAVANVTQLEAAAAAATPIAAPGNAAQSKPAKTDPVPKAQLDASAQVDVASALQAAGDPASVAMPSPAMSSPTMSSPAMSSPATPSGDAPRAAAEPAATAGFDMKLKVVSAATHFAPVSRLSPAQQIADALAASVGPMLGMSGGSAVSAAPPTGDAIATSAAADPAAVLAQPALGTIKTLNLQLQPDSLGPVTIKLNLSDGGLAVQLEAAHRQTADLIGKDKQAITQSLSDSGYSVASLDVRVAPQHGASLSGDASAQQGQADPNAGQAGGQASGFGGAPNGDRSTHDAPALAEPARGSQNPAGADVGKRDAGGGDLFV